jgi:hypothetical protein
MRFAPLLSAVLGAIAASALPQQQNLYELFTSPENAWHRDTILSFPGSPAFYNATLRWTPSANPQYFAAISPANEADVAKAVGYEQEC